jgi:hypothetical protein
VVSSLLRAPSRLASSVAAAAQNRCCPGDRPAAPATAFARPIAAHLGDLLVDDDGSPGGAEAAAVPGLPRLQPPGSLRAHLAAGRVPGDQAALGVPVGGPGQPLGVRDGRAAVPGVFLMYPRPHRIWVAGLVRQSAPAYAIFDAGRELPVR